MGKKKDKDRNRTGKVSEIVIDQHDTVATAKARIQKAFAKGPIKVLFQGTGLSKSQIRDALPRTIIQSRNFSF